MPSANKTANIGLNQWLGNEYPKRQDFVDDNLIIDTEIKSLKDANTNNVSRLDNIDIDISNIDIDIDKINRLEEATMITTVDDTGFKNITETSNGYLSDIKIEGRTVKNIVGTNGKASVTLNNTLKTKVYTLLENVKANTPMYFRVNVTSKKAPINGLKLSCHNIDGTYTYYTLTTGVYEQTNVITNPKEISAISLYMPQTEFDADATAFITYEKLQLTLFENSGYFEGLQSVGQDVNKLVVSSVKADGNLLDFSNVYGNKPTNFKQEGTSISGDLTTSFDIYFTDINNSKMLRVEKNTNYIFSCKNVASTGRVVIALRDKNKANIAYQIIDARTTNYAILNTLNNEYVTICIYRQDTTGIFSISDLMFNKGTAPIPYQSIETDKKEILYLDTADNTWKKPSLRGKWENGVMVFGDVAEKKADGKYSYGKRCGEVVLNGSEAWTHNSGALIDVYSMNLLMTDVKLDSDANKIKLICDKFKVLPSTGMNDLNIEFISVSTTGYIRLSILKTKATDLATAKAWLSTNNITIVYELAEEKVYECTPIDVASYNPETNYLIESGVLSPRSTIKCQNYIGEIVNNMKEKISNLENIVYQTSLATFAIGLNVLNQ